jgi:tRNA pseudouridine32 synthase/23S rRNA pseudouridine746 synthase
VQPGDTLQVSSAVPPTAAPPLSILYEDDAVIAVDKPAGMPSAPTRQAASGSALDTLRTHLRSRDGRPAALWVVHRLDSDTSGVLVFARTREAAALLSQAFAAQHVEKTYLARVAGTVVDDAGTIDLPLRAAERGAVVADDGKAAQTEWQVAERAASTTLLSVRPRTGRLHQIRVHLKAIGHPVIGDRRYGGPPAPRLMLHAARVRLPHPTRGVIVDIEAPEPPALSARPAVTNP